MLNSSGSRADSVTSRTTIESAKLSASSTSSMNGGSGTISSATIATTPIAR